ncbi:redoxin domain-containing protein [Arcicella aquatica]|uniref:Thioredoxin peroxidase n=1 Tax=Arcicella aquatica TaxID=217141 RepID=A0ABU5QRP8_9BACT|nr:redoxin domain-containing protein [Arcicella aquatica]MEA5259514.1 redoxin domain-containing protein [Arcicella aquatica]
MSAQINSMPRIGDITPDFEVVTTIRKLKISDYNTNKWVISFSHPADFTPIYTTEMTGFANEQERFFDAHNCNLLGLSIDSIHSHMDLYLVKKLL